MGVFSSKQDNETVYVETEESIKNLHLIVLYNTPEPPDIKPPDMLRLCDALKQCPPEGTLVIKYTETMYHDIKLSENPSMDHDKPKIIQSMSKWVEKDHIVLICVMSNYQHLKYLLNDTPIKGNRKVISFCFSSPSVIGCEICVDVDYNTATVKDIIDKLEELDSIIRGN